MSSLQLVEKFNQIILQSSEIVLDKKDQITNVMICLLANGHLLIEDEPGVGKTTLAQTIAKLIGLKQQRIQFTNDLLPSDIIGQIIFNRHTQDFNFKEGPLFSELVIADELNRANPKTQSALLQAMEENEVSIDRKTYPLPEVFFLIATQNPRNQIGTYPLPESQVDRFMMSLHLDFISELSEIKIFMGENPRLKISELSPLIDQNELLKAQKIIKTIHVDQKIAAYVARILKYTREQQEDFTPLSTRSGIALIESCKAHAFLKHRTYVTPDDILQVIKPVFGHRLSKQDGLQFGERQVEKILQKNILPN